ncbi:S46 family peptidase [Dysgonomonas sp. 25]|uniref:S46 family peptidase n=1 Tax=Dysgonomonas sp. 25 TaxID=2302933 RepID=UPI0013D27761|nr:S46 family peptidase [Dysgonomonas sp. 25]NDV67625.1 S46 family peptidase [Dysgonomonas sp. 25]
MKKLLLSLAILLVACNMQADEGMWLLKELNRQSVAKMKQLGFKFPENKVYSEENPSLKDAVVIFGRGCTGVAVSDQGLIFTNHHCGFDAIQKLSSVEHDYLKDGFASQSFGEELPAEGLTIQFLQKSEDLTDYVLADVTDEDDEQTRGQKVNAKIKEYLKQYEGNEFISARIVPFYTQNKYYLVVYETFKDIRLVCTPPQSIGKYGDETDNWMWPRHTGDFSIFRVYANKDNKAANYDVANVPYKPKYSVPVSLNGYKENDYAMTIGYPGSTERYMSSWGIKQMVESEHKPRIAVRGAKQEIWREAMNADDAVRIKYAAKYAQSSNYWKNAIGMNEAIAKLGIIPQKEQIESRFNSWVNDKPANQAKYGEVLSLLKDGYTNTMDIAAVQTYFYETFFGGIEILRFASTYDYLAKQEGMDVKDELSQRLTPAFKDYEPGLDRNVMPVLMKLYAESVPAEYLPAIYDTIQTRFGGDYDKYAAWLYDNTAFTSLDAINAYYDNASAGDAKIDPAIEFSSSLNECIMKIYGTLRQYNPMISKGSRLFMAGLMEMEPNKAFYPDANFTQRLSYGSVGGYKPSDAVDYNYFTTPKGIFEKYVPNDPEFHVQEYILDALTKADWGRYADKDGSMHVNFLSNNDITGGNSGSPVFDKNANLIGLAFDGNWESLSGDITFNPELQRCINVDIRYVLYVVDKVMNCPRIVNELKIAK